MKRKTITILLTLLLVTGSFSLAAGEQKKSEQEEAEKALVEAKKMLRQRDWGQAVEALKQVSKMMESGQLDQTLYWLGYSLNKLGNDLGNLDQQLEVQEEAIGQLEHLMKKFPTSRWVDEARVLRLEIAEALYNKGFKKYKKYIVNGTTPDKDIELKMVALDALLHMDKEKAFPILEKIVKEKKDPELTDKALFILSQSGDPRFIPLLEDLALKSKDTQILEKAIYWLGQTGEPRALDTLAKIYRSSRDQKIKEKIIIAIFHNGSDRAMEELIELYKEEGELELKKKIIFWLGQSKNKAAQELITNILLD